VAELQLLLRPMAELKVNRQPPPSPPTKKKKKKERKAVFCKESQTSRLRTRTPLRCQNLRFASKPPQSSPTGSLPQTGPGQDTATPSQPFRTRKRRMRSSTRAARAECGQY
jgi:hypothetical protein